MNILCVGYYDKFSRFFIAIKKELEKDGPKVHFKIFSLYFSGFFYSLTKGVPSSLLSFKVWKNAFFQKKRYTEIIKTQSHYKNIDLHNLIAYQFKLNKNASQKHLLLQAISYIDLIAKEIEHYKPTAILLIGDARLPIEITKQLAEQHRIKVWYIEQGPFNTTFFDPNGVNANASIRNFSIDKPVLTKKKVERIDAFINRKTEKKYFRLPFYRGMDYFIEFILKNSIFYPPDLKIPVPFTKKHTLDKNRSFEQFGNLDSENSKKVVFLLICQVPFDVNMTHHSPHFSSHFEILKSVSENLPKNSVLVVREHPLYRGKYEKEFYTFLKENNVYIDCNKSSDLLLKKANVVIVNNSTVGLEAISKFKTVVALGNSYYDRSGLCLKLKNKNQLKPLLQHALEHAPNKAGIQAFLYEFLFHHLIEGHLTSEKSTAAKTISKRIQYFHKKQLPA